jgi:hypothetical protein
VSKIDCDESDITKKTKKKSNEKIENDITEKKWTRNCPKCDKVLNYANKHSYLWATRNTKQCKPCGMLNNTNGKGNAGKQHSEEDVRKQRERMIGNTYGKGKPKPDSWKVKISEKYKGLGNPFYGKNHTEEFKEKRKQNWNHFIEKYGRSAGRPRHNPKACVYFNQLNELMGWDGHHAQYGGEKQVGKYFVDYYDPDKNIVVEYDEPFHERPSRKEKDIIRQNYIIRELNCKFYRYSEKNDMLYEVFYQELF